jgi:RING-box protein 1
MDQDIEMLELEEQPSSSESNGDASNREAAEQAECSTSRGYRRFGVRKWTAIALWSYDITVDNCAICRNHIMDKCIECQSVQEMTNIDENCTIAWGKCSHVFHMHCISKWLNTRQVCPLDNRNWAFKKYGT